VYVPLMLAPVVGHEQGGQGLGDPALSRRELRGLRRTKQSGAAGPRRLGLGFSASAMPDWTRHRSVLWVACVCVGRWHPTGRRLVPESPEHFEELIERMGRVPARQRW